MILRRVLPADWAAFRDIRLEMLRNEPTAFGSTYDEWAARSEADIRQWLSKIHVIGAIEAETILATAAFARQTRQTVQHRAEVVAVYTRPTARGQGLSAKLLAEVLRAARAEGVLQVELQVAAWNSRAIQLYEGLGFRSIGTLPRALCHDGVFTDDLLMVRPLDGRDPLTA